MGGPTYETVTDCRLYSSNGADVVGKLKKKKKIKILEKINFYLNLKV